MAVQLTRPVCAPDSHDWKALEGGWLCNTCWLGVYDWEIDDPTQPPTPEEVQGFEPMEQHRAVYVRC